MNYYRIWWGSSGGRGWGDGEVTDEFRFCFVIVCVCGLFNFLDLFLVYLFLRNVLVDIWFLVFYNKVVVRVEVNIKK